MKNNCSVKILAIITVIKFGSYYGKIAKFQIIISCAFIAFALIISSLIFSSKISKNENITVTGSAYKIVKSDS